MFPFEATLAGYAQTVSESFCAGTKSYRTSVQTSARFLPRIDGAKLSRTVLESGASHRIGCVPHLSVV